MLRLKMGSVSFVQSLQEWQRLSPLSVVFFIGKIITRLVKDALPSMAPLAVIIFNADNKVWLTAIILMSLLALLLISSFLQYWFFKFKQQDDKVLINDGVFKKNHRVIQFDRIQNINILQPLYFRPFGLVTLQIETAGAKGNEADLAGIPADFADLLKKQVLQQLAKEKDQKQAGESVHDSEHYDQIIAEASLPDLVKYGVSSNGVFWFFILLTPIVSLGDDFLKKWFSKDDFRQIAETFGSGPSGEILFVLMIILVTIILMFGFSILGAILRYFRYQLCLTQSLHPTLKRSSGLLTNYEESLKLQKIQTLIIQSNFIGRWFQVNNLTLGQVSSSQNQAKNRKSLFVIPARNCEETSQLRKTVFSDSPDEIKMTGINRRYVNKTMALKIFLPSLLVCSIIYFSNGAIWLLSIPFIFSLLMLPLVIKRWKAYKFGMNEGYGKFQRGLFGFRHILFPLYKVQRAEVRQSPIQRRRNLATLKVYLASNRIQMQYIPIKEANRWLDMISKQIEENTKQWY